MISRIGAPHLSSRFVMCTFWPSVIPSGSASSDDPPPDIRNITSSPRLLARRNLMDSFAALTLVLSGTGWPALNIRNFLPLTADLDPLGIVMTPPDSLSCSMPFAALVIESAALPNATVYTPL